MITGYKGWQLSSRNPISALLRHPTKKSPDISALGTVKNMNPPGWLKNFKALLADAEEHGASLALRTRIRGGQVYDTGIRWMEWETGKPFWMWRGVTGTLRNLIWVSSNSSIFSVFLIPPNKNHWSHIPLRVDLLGLFFCFCFFSNLKQENIHGFDAFWIFATTTTGVVLELESMDSGDVFTIEAKVGVFRSHELRVNISTGWRLGGWPDFV